MKTMMLMLLVACMGFAVQSCGSDDDKKDLGTAYTLASTVDVKNKGSFSDAEIQALIELCTVSETGYYLSDAAAAAAAEKVVQKLYTMLQVAVDNVDWTHEECNIVFSIVTTNTSSKKVVSSWTITIHKGITKQQLLL